MTTSPERLVPRLFSVLTHGYLSKAFLASMNAFVPGLLTSGLACISGRGLNMLSRRSGRKAV
jgi:hypothetical protein